ncbi:uncharacterized protein TRIADDRAFT_5000, partial [Trichoplax adhaerens]
DTVAGAAAGAACVVAGQPLDTVKVKMQTFSHLYRGSLQCFMQTFKSEGLRGLYAGSSPAFLTNVAENSVLFLSYGQCLSATQYLFHKDSIEDLKPVHRAIAGSMAAVVATLVICPTELVKCRLQAHAQLVEKMLSEGGSFILQSRMSSLKVLSSVLREEGIRGLYRGYSSTLIRDPGGYFFFFFGYEFTKKALTPKDSEPGCVLTTMFAGGMGGAALWTVIYPLDLVKSRQQVFAKAEQRGFVRMLSEISRTTGFFSLYRGLAPTIIRSFPANGALFLTYEYTKKLL